MGVWGFLLSMRLPGRWISIALFTAVDFFPTTDLKSFRRCQVSVVAVLLGGWCEWRWPGCGASVHCYFTRAPVPAGRCFQGCRHAVTKEFVHRHAKSSARRELAWVSLLFHRVCCTFRTAVLSIIISCILYL